MMAEGSATTSSVALAQSVFIDDVVEATPVYMATAGRGPTTSAVADGAPAEAPQDEATRTEHEQVHREATRRFWVLEAGLTVDATSGATRPKMTATQQAEGAEMVRLWRGLAGQGFAEA